MNIESEISDFLYKYRKTSIKILRGEPIHRNNFDQEYLFPYRPEISAIESFLIIRCLDGVIAYGFSQSNNIFSNVSIEEQGYGIAIAKETIPYKIHDLLRILGVSPFLRVEDKKEYLYRSAPIGFAAYLFRHPIVFPNDASIFGTPYRNEFYFWRDRDIYSNGNWFSIFVFSSKTNYPDPHMLASIHWRHLQVERNFGSLSAANDLVNRFTNLLNSAVREEELQLFLEDHPEVILPDYIKSYPKFRLADEYITDFVLLGGNGYEFIEIERPEKSIFTKNNQLTSEITQAENQILDWRIIIEKEHAFFERRLPRLYRPKFRLIYGRDRTLTIEQKHKLKTRFNDIQFDTYDDICERFKRIIYNLRNEQSGRFH